jgi:hypothetical protein
MATADLGGVEALVAVAWHPDVDDRNVLAVAHRRRSAHRPARSRVSSIA